MIITDPQKLQKTLRTIQPVSVAVAYIGKAWLTYLDEQSLPQTLVVSPTLGSHPPAIAKAIQKLGIDNVHFLDELHAKIYLGNKQALVGSCNLSHGGFRDKEETAVLITDEKQILVLHATIARYIDFARRDYPNARAKRDRLAKLYLEHKNAPKSHGPKRRSRKTPNIGNYDVDAGQHRIHVAWGQPDNITFNKEAVYNSEPAAKNQNLDAYFGSCLLFHENDDIRKGDWILYWHNTNKGMPRRNGEISWIFVDAVIAYGVKDDKYTKLAGEIKARDAHPEPFLLDDRTKNRIRTCLTFGQFAALRSEDDNKIWYLNDADKVVPDFLRCIQRRRPRR